MPKKFGTHTKAQEAREKKAAQKEQMKAKKAKEEEDAKWVEDDEHVLRKLQRKEEKEAKRIEALNRRRELQKLHDEEMSKLVSAKTKNQTTNANKLTQAQIAAARERLAAQQAALEKKNKKGNVETVDHLEDNPNIVPTLPSGEREEVLSARTVEEAIGILSINDPTADATSAVGTTNFSEYAKKMMPILKQEYPELRDRQLTDKCFKMYQRAAENPRNQAKLNAK